MLVCLCCAAGLTTADYLVCTRGTSPRLYDVNALGTFGPATRTAGGGSRGSDDDRRAPIVTRVFMDSTIVPVRIQAFSSPGTVVRPLGPAAFASATCAMPTPYGAAGSPLTACFDAIEGVRVELVEHLADMQRRGVAVEPDDYGGQYVKFGVAAGEGRHRPADAWLLPVHDKHMEDVAKVFALMIPLLRFAAVCMRGAGAEPDDCSLSPFRRRAHACSVVCCVIYT